MKKFLVLILLIFSSFIVQSQRISNEIIVAIQEEVERNFNELQKQDVKPYYISVRIQELASIYITSSFGSLENSRQNESYNVKINIKLGDKTIKSPSYTHSLPISVAILGNSLDVRTYIWREISVAYNMAFRQIAKHQSEKAIGAKLKDKAPYFSSPEKAVVYRTPKVIKHNLTLPSQKSKDEKANYLSKEFLKNPDIIDCDVRYSINSKVNYFIDSEGAQITESASLCHLRIGAQTQAKDGMNIYLHEDYYAELYSDLPSDKEVLADLKKISSNLSLLKKAPLAEPYSGVVMVSPKVTGLFFNEFFGRNILGSNLKDQNNAGTFRDKVGEQVSVSDLSIVYDPTIKKYRGESLNGYYLYDEEGIKAERVDIVKDGVLKGFLMGRLPIDNFPISNGHGRGNFGTEQSNMFISSSNPKGEEEFKAIFINEIKAQGKEYGYYIDKVSGGNSSSNVYRPSTFNISPTLIYKIWADGRPNELVRGVSLIGTPMIIFNQIMAIGDKNEVYNSITSIRYGREGRPISTISPAIIIRNIETQRVPPSVAKPILLKRPDIKHAE